MSTDYFDPGWYRRQAASGARWSGSKSLAHYRSVGWRLGFDPHPSFSTDGYLADHPDVRTAGAVPLDHYLHVGRAEGRSIVSVAEYAERPSDRRIVRRVSWFDLGHYRSQVPSIRSSSVLEGLDHYLAVGWREGVDPHPRFSTEGYLHDNPDVRADGMDPLTHFVRHGLAEGRSPVAPVDFASPNYRTPDSVWIAESRASLGEYLHHLEIPVDVDEIDLLRASVDEIAEPEWFDAAFYLHTYGDVANTSVPALRHFLFTGHREGRFPNAAAAGTMALRSDTERVLLARTPQGSLPIGRRAAVDVRDPVDMAREILERSASHENGIVISFGHDDYATHVGGIQIVAAREAADFGRCGTSYLSVFPADPQLVLDDATEPGGIVRCRLDGVEISGATPLVDLMTALSAEFANRAVTVVVHSVLGHAPEAIDASVRVLSPLQLVWWIHDYSAHCENYRMTRNGVSWCGDPAITSQSCTLCSFGPRRLSHVTRVRVLLDAHPWIVVAPSETAASQSVAGHTSLGERPIVVPHGGIVRTGDRREVIDPTRPVRIAFVGHPATIKGWNRFMAFVADVGAFGGEFEFFHLGVEDRSVPGVRFIAARPTADGTTPVTDLLVEHRIDAVMNFVDGKETFNFVTYEAMAAGCCVITSPRSGNVLAAATEESLAVEVADETEAFDYEWILAEVRRRRRDDIGAFVLTGLTPAVLRGVGR